MYDSKVQKKEVRPFNYKSALAYTILSFLSSAISIFLLVWLILKQYGFFYISPIKLSSCNPAYYILKYSNSNIIIAMWVAIVLSLITSAVLTIIWISRLVAKAVSQKTKYATAILQSLKLLSAAVLMGHCLTFFIQFNKINPNDCIVVYDWTILITLTGLAIGDFVLSLIRYFICIFRDPENETDLVSSRQAQNYESLVNVTNDSFVQNPYPPQQLGPNPIRQHPIRQYAPTKIKQYPLNSPKKQYPINTPPIDYSAKQHYPAPVRQHDPYRQYNNRTDMDKLQKAIPKYAKSPKKIKYVGQNQSVKSEEWETVAPSKADKFFNQAQQKQQQEYLEKSFKLRQNSRKQPYQSRRPQKEDFNNIFLDNQSESSRNQPLFVPEQPFHYQSLAAKIINKNRRDQGISKALSVKKVQPQQRQLQKLEMKQQNDMWVAPTEVRVQSENSNAYASQAIRRNYQRRLNKY